MKRSKKIAIIIALSAIALGIVAMAGALFAMNGGFELLQMNEITETTYAIDEEFTNISADVRTADLRILVSEDEKIKVVAKENSDYTYTVEVADGTLRIRETDNRKWYEHISFNIVNNSGEIAVYMPIGEYGELALSSSTGDAYVQKGFTFETAHVDTDTGDLGGELSVKGSVVLKTDTGDMDIAALSAEALFAESSTGDINIGNLSVSADTEIDNETGKTTLSNGELARLDVESDTGDVVLNNVRASGNMALETDTGDVELRGCDASELHITTDTGDVYGRLLSEKIYIARSDTGDIRVPSSASGGVCEIITDTGDIDFE